MSLATQVSGGGVLSVAVNVQAGDILIPITPDVAREVDRSPRTIKRWIADPSMNFPKTVLIRGRLYVRRAAFEAWKRDLFWGKAA